jgi:hypothetical protein
MKSTIFLLIIQLVFYKTIAFNENESWKSVKNPYNIEQLASNQSEKKSKFFNFKRLIVDDTSSLPNSNPNPNEITHIYNVTIIEGMDAVITCQISNKNEMYPAVEPSIKVSY